MIKAKRRFLPPGGLVRLDLRGGQRRRFLFMAGVSVAFGLINATRLPSVIRRPDPIDVWFLVGWFGIFAGFALYFVRVAYGWVEVDAAGLRTSRLIRGRAFSWAEVGRITTRTSRGMGGGVTAVRVHTRAGRTYYLPAPRTTAVIDPEFEKAMRYLRSRVWAR